MSQENPFFKFYGAKSKFVYYNDLQRTYPDIYNKLLNEKILYSAKHNSKMESIAQNMMQFAAIEGAKEISLLEKFFNVNGLSLSEKDLYNSSIGIEIVNSINTALQFKEAYERHLTRIIGKNG